MEGPSRAFVPFVVAVVLGGCLALREVGQGWHKALAHPAIATVLVILLLATELVPVVLPYRRAEVQVSTSTTFTVAMLLLGGVGPVLVAQLSASLIADLVHRKSLLKTSFNLGQLAIALVASATILKRTSQLGPLDSGLFRTGDLLSVVVAVVVFLVLNNGLVWIAVSLASRSSFPRRVRDEWVFSAVSGLVLSGLAPVVDLVAIRALPMLPLLLIPVGAIYLTARSSVAQAHQALHDGLTGLANRTRFRAEVRTALEEGGRTRRRLGVLLVDLDRFKEINDTLGHHTGDVLLCQIGPRLEAASPAVALVARLGGDEFAVLLGDVEGPEQALEAARTITRSLEEPFVLDDGLMLEVEASVGVVVTPDHGCDVDLLMQRADVAMYLAKTSRSGVELYAPERDDNTRRRLTLIGQLRTAIGNDELSLHYQPKLNLATNGFSGVEALVRWTHPELGVLAPDEFIPLAERSGLIKPLTRFVLQTAITQAKRWHDDGLSLRVAINLSARTFLDYDLPSMIGGLLAHAGMSPEWLELEITETELMADPERGAKVLERLHLMGIRLTIDDFGTGHSSLAYLRSLPVDEIKIDRCFVAAMAVDGVSADDIIVRSTIELAANLGLEVTAEGVESAAQLRRLTELGCHFLQGYYLSRPMPADELFTLLAASSALAPRHIREPFGALPRSPMC